jgi:homoserine O-acetyltransferase/O-succinyltransferase
MANRLRTAALAVLLPLLSLSLFAQDSLGDYTQQAKPGDFVLHNFQFHGGEILPDLRIHYVTWGTARHNATGEVTNAVLLLHGTLGAGINWGKPPETDPQNHPLFGPDGALNVGKYYVIAPDTIGSGQSSRPSDGLRMGFPRYNLEDVVRAEHMLMDYLDVRHLILVMGASMGGRQTWEWGVLYPDFMDALVPMVSSPFPNAGRRGVIDYLPEAIIKDDPAWKQGNYTDNPDSARLADLTYSLFLRTPAWYRQELPTRAEAEKWVRTGRGLFNWPDANDFIYMMELNNGFDAGSDIDKITCPVLMINMSNDNMVPVELGDAQKVAARLKNATYLEIKDEAAYGHGALGRTSPIWGPKLKEWLGRATGRK